MAGARDDSKDFVEQVLNWEADRTGFHGGVPVGAYEEVAGRRGRDVDGGAGKDADGVRAVQVGEADAVFGREEVFSPGGPVSEPQGTGVVCIRDVRGWGGGAECAAGVTMGVMCKHGI